MAINSAPVFGIAGTGKVTTRVGPRNDDGHAVALAPDGRLVMVGTISDGLGGSDFGVVRYLDDGTLDSSFGGTGKVVTPVGPAYDSAEDVAVLADGSVLVLGHARRAGGSFDTDVALVRYRPDGSLDTGFGGGDGIALGPAGMAVALAVQPDGRILVAATDLYGTTTFVVRYLADGSLDASFGTAGVYRADGIRAWGMALQDDGRVVVAGEGRNGPSDPPGFAVLRVGADGRADTSFDGDGRVVLDLQGYARDVAIDGEGRILVTGTAGGDFVTARLDADGSLDASFSGDGVVSTAIGPEVDNAWAIGVQPDGRILVGGFARSASSQDDFALVRYNADGSLDTGFGTGGKVLTPVGFEWDYGKELLLQPDGKIVLAGQADNPQDDDFALVRYNPDGSLDRWFGATGTLNGRPVHVEGGRGVVMDADVRVIDAQLTATRYDGATLTIERHGGASAEDVFSAAHSAFDAPVRLRPLVEGQSIVLANVGTPGSSVAVGTVLQNSDGRLVLAFNDQATQVRVDAVLQQLAYANTREVPPATVRIDWTFSDGNTGAQGTGGALSATGSTLVAIAAVNDAPSFSAPGSGRVRASADEREDIASGLLLQPDGKALVVGRATRTDGSSDSDFELLRFDADGTIDHDFGQHGVSIVSFGERSAALTAALQDDGQILVVGRVASGPGQALALARLRADGQLDEGFGNDGVLTLGLGAARVEPIGLRMQSDGGFVVGVVRSGGSLAAPEVGVVRFDADGSLDPGFGGGDGIATHTAGAGDLLGGAVTIDGQGRFVVAAGVMNGDQFDVVVLRYLADGGLDHAFGNGGLLRMATTDVREYVTAVAVDALGRIVVGGCGSYASAAYISPALQALLVRVNEDGTPDAAFGTAGRKFLGDLTLVSSLQALDGGRLMVAGSAAGLSEATRDVVLLRLDADGRPEGGFGGGDGVATVNIGGVDNVGAFLALGSDGRVTVATSVNDAAASDAYDVGLLRFAPDGQLDLGFGQSATLDGVTLVERGGAAAVLDPHLRVSDAEMDAAGSHAGASLTLSRQGGADPGDRFLAAAGGSLGALLEGGALTLDGETVGTVVANSDGTLVLRFGMASAAQVAAVMQQIAYAHEGSTAAGLLAIEWVFSDGNAGAQGTGGARSATGTSTVALVGDLVQVPGSDAAENLQGTPGDDHLRGFGGRDTLAGGAGNDLIDGGAGIDTASFAIPRGLAVVQALSVEGAPLATVGAAQYGVDRLVDVERLAFTDRHVALDVLPTGNVDDPVTKGEGGNAGKAYRLYQAAFDRTPDLGGLGYWIKQIDEGATLFDIATGFLESAEFQALYGVNPDNAAYTRALYLNVLDREPDDFGYAYWNAVLSGEPYQGVDYGQTTRQQMLVDFSESPENKANLAGIIGNGFDYDPWLL